MKEILMTTLAIRQKLHSYLELADGKKLKAIYTFLADDINESAIKYTPELKKELDTRYAEYKKGSAKVITASESKRRVKRVLKSVNK